MGIRATPNHLASVMAGRRGFGAVLAIVMPTMSTTEAKVDVASQRACRDHQERWWNAQPDRGFTGDRMQRWPMRWLGVSVALVLVISITWAPGNDPASQSLAAFGAHLTTTLRPLTKLTFAVESSAGLAAAPSRRVFNMTMLLGCALCLLFLLRPAADEESDSGGCGRNSSAAGAEAIVAIALCLVARRRLR
jgi:hypothetical protein